MALLGLVSVLVILTSTPNLGIGSCPDLEHYVEIC